MDQVTLAGVAGPVAVRERIGVLDVLRGFALLGVLVSNFVWFAAETIATEAQKEAFRAVPLDAWTMAVVDWLVSDKANTLFAFLFGVGFWIQLERAAARGADFQRLYLRRLGVLLVMGLINLWLIWPHDILHLYALCGLVLFAARGLPQGAMLALGLVLAIPAAQLVYFLFFQVLGLGAARKLAYAPEAVAARQEVLVGGSYGDWISAMAWLNWQDYMASGMIAGLALYVFGRFLLGAYVARRGWLRDTERLLPRIRTVFLVALPLGLLIEALVTAGRGELLPMDPWLIRALHAVGSPMLATGYATGLILAFHSRGLRGAALLFAPVGRMALTNYLVQGVFIGLLLYGFHGGLGLAGTIAPHQVLAASLAFFAAQTVFSHWWLSRYAFGPVEWLWRALTYSERPAMRRPAEGAALPVG